QDGLKAQEKSDFIAEIVKEVQFSIASDQFDRAVTAIAEGLRKYPNEPALLRSQSKISYARQQYERQMAIRQSNKRALELRSEKRYSEAISELEKTIRTWEAQEL